MKKHLKLFTALFFFTACLIIVFNTKPVSKYSSTMPGNNPTVFHADPSVQREIESLKTGIMLNEENKETVQQIETKPVDTTVSPAPDNSTKEYKAPDKVPPKSSPVQPNNTPDKSPPPVSTVQSGKMPDIEGIKLFPADNFWNTPVDTLKVHPKSQDYINTIGNDRRLHPDFGTFWNGSPIGIPYNVVPSSQPKVNVSFDYDDESDKGPYPIPEKPIIEGGSDRHLLILQKDTNVLYELFNVQKQKDGNWHAGSGAIWHLDKNEVRPKGWTSADAAGLAILPGLVRWDEVYQKGEINHAFRVTLSKIQRSYILPATHSGGRYTGENYPPMGLRLRLKTSIDITGYSKDMQVILKAMKKYGLVVADVGSDMYVTGTHDSRWNDEALNALKKLKASDFEAVYTGDAIPY